MLVGASPIDGSLRAVDSRGSLAPEVLKGTTRRGRGTGELPRSVTARGLTVVSTNRRRENCRWLNGYICHILRSRQYVLCMNECCAYLDRGLDRLKYSEPCNASPRLLNILAAMYSRLTSGSKTLLCR